MSANTSIQWAHHTFNPWWGCYEQSPACDHCYAREWAKRFGVLWGSAEAPRFASEKQWEDPFKWQRRAARKSTRFRVFTSSMGDVMDPRSIFDPHRARLYGVIEQTPRLDWMLLTKQPKNLKRLLPKRWLEGGLPKNVWLGVTAENPDWLARRLGYLLEIPAQVHFLSMEPLLAATPLDRVKIRGGALHGKVIDPLRGIDDWGHVVSRSIGWVIAGGESGQKARPMHPDWVRSIRDSCAAADVPFFFKQWGRWAPPAFAQEEFTGKRELWMLPSGELERTENPHGIKLVHLRSKKQAADHEGYGQVDGAYHLSFPKQARLCA